MCWIERAGRGESRLTFEEVAAGVGAVARAAAAACPEKEEAGDPGLAVPGECVRWPWFSPQWADSVDHRNHHD